MEKKNKGQTGSEKTTDYVETVREGAVAANIFRGKTQDGLDYHYFKFSRAFKSAKQKDSADFTYSDRFFPRNSEAIAKVAVEAAEKCEQLDKELDAGSVEPAKQAA